MSFKGKLRISHHRMKQVLNKFRIKWCLSSYFSLPAKLLLIQSGIFGPIRAPTGRFDNIDSTAIWFIHLVMEKHMIKLDFVTTLLRFVLKYSVVQVPNYCYGIIINMTGN